MNVTVTMQFSSMDEVSDFFRGHSASGVPNFQPAQTMVVEKPPVTPLSPAATEAVTPAEAAFGKALKPTEPAAEQKRRPGRPPKNSSVHGANAGVASNPASSEPVCQAEPPDAPLAGVAAVAIPAEVVVEPSVGGDAITIDAVRNALAAVNSAKGLEAARAVLGEFDAGRISDVKESAYPAFIARCQEAAK